MVATLDILKRLTHERSMVQNLKFFITCSLLLDLLGLEIMSDDHLVKKQALLDDKKNQFYTVATLKFFQRG